ncbi:Imm1 family immunity protein [Rhodopseudomonas sp. P2A-2r]|uniref:Imm1 family immunity protein n=1 Tax=unclassified Rhodopseudomonas TaxID=2638247 RepID=UPI002234C925|nr:Imm1 family immunity protein [Rhodopseudomonas sp. P2A-2r]UZE47603.1 Imm1 family immunity protein [Rhodopseudomonas sp. P2A-2r]
MDVKGLDGTAALPEINQVGAALAMVGKPELGVYLAYDKWDGREQKKFNYNARGDLSRLGEFVRSLHDTPLSVGLFIPFPLAWKAVKEFMETDGEIPTSIEWIASKDLPPEAFPVPRPPNRR